MHITKRSVALSIIALSSLPLTACSSSGDDNSATSIARVCPKGLTAHVVSHDSDGETFTCSVDTSLPSIDYPKGANITALVNTDVKDSATFPVTAKAFRDGFVTKASLNADAVSRNSPTIALMRISDAYERKPRP